MYVLTTQDLERKMAFFNFFLTSITLENPCLTFTTFLNSFNAYVYGYDLQCVLAFYYEPELRIQKVAVKGKK